MWYFIKVGASRLKQCLIFFIKNGSLNTIDFVKICNLEILYFVFGNEVSLRHLKF